MGNEWKIRWGSIRTVLIMHNHAFTFFFLEWTELQINFHSSCVWNGHERDNVQICTLYTYILYNLWTRDIVHCVGKNCESESCKRWKHVLNAFLNREWLTEWMCAIVNVFRGRKRVHLIRRNQKRGATREREEVALGNNWSPDLHSN